MKIIYRISDTGYNKVKPDYIDNEKCLQNFCNVFYDHTMIFISSQIIVVNLQWI
jgi:hypothetical protein